jgi:Core-2/I-Branching enzyme
MHPPAAIILAHNDPTAVRRLIGSLEGLEILLHCDRRSPLSVFAEMVKGAEGHIRVLPRMRTGYYSWGVVEAELAALRVALESTRAEHIIVMSGSCYPLVSMGELQEELARWSSKTRMKLSSLPHHGWNTKRNPDGGMWRFRRRFVTFRSQIVYVGSIPLRTVRREPPAELQLKASSQWKIYSRPHALALLSVLDGRPDLVKFWRTTLLPDESCAASILSSPELVGTLSEDVCDDSPWYIDWKNADPPEHPCWLTVDDFPSLVAARAAPPRPPVKFVDDPSAYRKLFARKVSSRDSALLDMIDELLRT